MAHRPGGAGGGGQAFRELGVQCQVLRKKEGSKEFGAELKALEARLKRVQLQARPRPRRTRDARRRRPATHRHLRPPSSPPG